MNQFQTFRIILEFKLLFISSAHAKGVLHFFRNIKFQNSDPGVEYMSMLAMTLSMSCGMMNVTSVTERKLLFRMESFIFGCL